MKCDVGFDGNWPILDLMPKTSAFVRLAQDDQLTDSVAEFGKGGAVLRNLVAASLLVSAMTFVSPMTSVALAQDWAYKLVEGPKTHDFGTVARAAKAEHVFEMQNIFKEAIHIAGVRASCGCAIPRVLEPTLETWEKGGIAVEFNTRSFQGQRKATITVTIDKPYYAEIQFVITGYIRGDIVFDPGTVNFDSVSAGDEATRTVNVNYAGRSDWQIVDVRSANTNLVVEPTETHRQSGRVGYKLKVQLKPETPAGYFNDQMVLITNDRNQRQIPLLVEGNILSPLTVSPAALALGVVSPGQTVTRSLVVRAKQPFRITRVACGDDCFQFEPSDSAKELHVVPVRFTAGQDDGDVSAQIVIETDLGSGAAGNVSATATVRSSDG